MLKKSLAIMCLCVCVFGCAVNGYAAPSMDIETETTTTVKKEESDKGKVSKNGKKGETTKSIDMDKVQKDVGGLSALMGGVTIDEDTAADINEKMEPAAYIVKYVIGFGLAIISLGMLVYTVADLMYINLPITRDMLSGTKMVSDDAHSLGDESASKGMGGYGNFGGYGDEYGSSGYGGNDGQQVKGNKNSRYFKARAKTLILFSICSVLTLSTLFTQFGLAMGNWILKAVMYFI